VRLGGLPTRRISHESFEDNVIHHNNNITVLFVNVNVIYCIDCSLIECKFILVFNVHINKTCFSVKHISYFLVYMYNFIRVEAKNIFGKLRIR